MKNITPSLKLGAFSVSLAVKDLQLSKKFYETLGFSVMGGDPAQNWLILKNESCVIGLFQGMFASNILTFNPGWDQNAATLDNYDDVRSIQKHLTESGVQTEPENISTENGPAHFMITDPDGNTILFDQHV
jgi:predicted lactoylglutathione lyase